MVLEDGHERWKLDYQRTISHGCGYVSAGVSFIRQCKVLVAITPFKPVKEFQKET